MSHARDDNDAIEAYASGWGDFTTAHVARLTGRAPRSLELFAREILAPAIRQHEAR